MSMGTSTRSLHADSALNVVSDVAAPLHISTTFRYPDNPDELVPAAEHTEDLAPTSHIYSRYSAPNTTRFETILSSLLNGHVISYSSGLSALHAALTMLNPRRISIGDGYHGCHGVIKIMTRLTGLQKLSLDCPADQLNENDLILLETPVNPTGLAFDITAYAEKAHSRGAYLMVDSTFAPPGLQDPFRHGADLVMHSGTKYFGGHSDMLSGVLATKNEEWISRLKEDRLYLGNVMGSMEGWLGSRSLRSMELRVKRQSENATNLVQWIDSALRVQSPETDSDDGVIQSAVEKIYHASLQEADNPWLSKQMPNGYGPVFAMLMKTESHARRLPSRLALFDHATSLGGVESLVEWRAMSDPTVDRRLVRVSTGVENWGDLRDDLGRAFRGLNCSLAVR